MRWYGAEGAHPNTPHVKLGGNAGFRGNDPCPYFIRPYLQGLEVLGTIQTAGSMLSTVSMLARVSVILADTIVIGATWMSLHRQVKESLELRLRSRTSAILLADGELAFTSLTRQQLTL